mmetsp:Transcript_10516/g.23896  ORF Transcript_10516/g.23896 Transcript_10516/m.23896 type:complete len:452 (-) Transcript_10516:102-1457(-)
MVLPRRAGLQSKCGPKHLQKLVPKRRQQQLPPRLRSTRSQKILQEHVNEVRRAVRQGVWAGCATTVYHKGHAVLRRSYGQADLERRTRFDHDSICRIYCMTKSYTLFTAMLLSDEGILDLDAEVATYLPSLQKMMVQAEGAQSATPAKTAMLVRHLATHSAGFSYQADFNFPPEDAQRRYRHLVRAVAQGRITRLDRYVDELAKVPLCFEPGQRYEYGHSIDVLGRVLEVVTGRSLGDLLREKLFQPLGMQDTDFLVPQEKLHRLSGVYGNAKTWGHLYGDRQGVVPVVSKPGLVRLDGSAPAESAWSHDQVSILSGGGFLGHNCGGLVSTARDTEAFVQMLLAGGRLQDGRQLVRPSTLAKMERNQLVGPLKPEDPSTRWCMLGDMIKDSRSLYYQMGGAAGTYWQIDRKREMGIVFFAQQVDGEDWDKLGFNEARAEVDAAMREILDGR